MDVESTGAWCELIKDIVTMANSGGGALVFGVDDQGKLSDADLTPLLALDSAKVMDKIAPYTGVQFPGFEIRPGQRDGKCV
jgi:predicted HTH transcriptional regulator